MKASSSTTAICSTCGTSLTATGECAACLVRLGFDETDEEAASSVFGDYEIARREDGSLWELGRGAMGVTYRAQDKVLNRAVALKVVEAPQAAMDNKAVRERFLREARAAAAFRHPNVAGVFHFGSSAQGDRCYYAMELVAGETLEARVRRDGPLPVEAALEMAAQISRALVAAAANNLIHRDLKPGNIMLTRSADATAGLEVKVIDFGLAKATAESGNEMDLTQGAFLGTPAFASPEQIRGAPADARTDIYSLGATLWYALTGAVPYEGKTIDEIRRRQSELPLPIDKLVAHKAPKPVIRLLCGILAIDPGVRPASARELMEAVEACRAHLGHTRPNELKMWSNYRKLAALTALLALGAAAFFAFRLLDSRRTAPNLPSPKSIAVLPFENLSDEKQNAYFAEGVQDEILTRLAKIADLKVISRTSTQRFKSAPGDLRQIGQQLGVAHILEGSVQKAGDRVRISVQLINVSNDSHLWAERYDRKLIDVFEVESDVAQKIAASLESKLTGREQKEISAAGGTKIPEAYDAYLRALAWMTKQGPEAMQNWIASSQRAVELDPNYAQAWANLAIGESQKYFLSFSRVNSAEQLARARAAAETALRLAPELSEAHAAMGLFYYYCLSDYDRALKELSVAREGTPNSATVLLSIGLVQRRQGKVEASIELQEQAAKLDPLNEDIYANLGRSFRSMRNFNEARAMFDRALTIMPGDPEILVQKAETYLAQGDLESASRLVSDLKLPPTSTNFNIYLTLFRSQRRFDDIIAIISSRLAEEKQPQPVFVAINHAALGRLYRLKGDEATARSFLLQAERELKEMPKEGRLLENILLQVEARLGHRAEVEELAAAYLARIEKDKFTAPHELGVAKAYAILGDFDRALPFLEHALTARYLEALTPAYLRFDPEWDPVRNDPRFQKLANGAP